MKTEKIKKIIKNGISYYNIPKNSKYGKELSKFGNRSIIMTNGEKVRMESIRFSDWEKFKIRMERNFDKGFKIVDHLYEDEHICMIRVAE